MTPTCDWSLVDRKKAHTLWERLFLGQTKKDASEGNHLCGLMNGFSRIQDENDMNLEVYLKHLLHCICENADDNSGWQLCSLVEPLLQRPLDPLGELDMFRDAQVL